MNTGYRGLGPLFCLTLLLIGLVKVAIAWLDKDLMSTEQHIEVEGTVSVVLPNMMFRVRLDSGHEVLAHPAGQMRRRFVRLTPGDRVRLEMSPYDLTKGRISRRLP